MASLEAIRAQVLELDPHDQHPGFDESMTTTLRDAESDQDVVVATARHIGEFAMSIDHAYRRGLHAFYELYRTLDNHPARIYMVQDENYRHDTRAEHLGIMVVGLPDIAQQVTDGVLLNRRFNTKLSETFLAFCEHILPSSEQ